MLAESFSELDFDRILVERAHANGIAKPSELQTQLMPALRSGQNVLLRASDGGNQKSGYLLPLMQHLLGTEPLEGKGPRALILSPSRDVAMQIGRDLKALGSGTPLRFGAVVGGRPYPTQHQLLRRPLDILIATPSRLADHMRRGHVPFERLQLLLVDAVDEMLSGGMIDDVDFIIASTKQTSPQTLLLSRHIHSLVEIYSQRIQGEARRIELAVGQSDEQNIGAEMSALEKSKGGPRRRSPYGRLIQSGRPSAHKNARKPSTGGDKGAGNGRRGAGKAAGEPQKKSQLGNRGKSSRSNGRRTGKNPRQVEVRFPSDYANGPRKTPDAADVVEQHREVKRHEPSSQYLADYGFSKRTKERKPVTITYRNKGRKAARSGEESDNNKS